MNLKKYLFYLLITSMLSANSVRIIPPQSDFDSSHSYFFTLLSKIFEADITKYGKTEIVFSKQMEQGRALLQLEKNKDIDIYWAGTSNTIEKKLRAIKIPLVKGTLGYRVLVINKKNKKRFDDIQSIEELKKLKACQGAHWADSKILEKAGFKVIRNPNYEAMFLQVSKNRCDYFPRGIHEGYSELEIRRVVYPDLTIYDDIIIYYPFPMYFFVSKENEKLALQIEEGLLSLIKTGEFDKLLQENTITKHLFPIKKWKDKIIYTIDNPLLSKDTDYKDEKFWINLNKKD